MLSNLFALAALLGLAPGDDLEDALALAKAAYPDARARGIRRLGELGTTAAWTCVRAALEDPEAQVADAAQRAMSQVEDDSVLAGWLGRGGLRDRDPWVRLRVAQVAGEVHLEVEARALIGALSPRGVELSRALCSSLEAQALAGRLVGTGSRTESALEGLLDRGRDPRLRADALAALVALDPGGGHRRLSLALAGGEPLLRAAALRLWRGPGVIGVAERHMTDADPRVRLAGLDRICEAQCRAMAELLVRCLETEPRLNLRRRAVASLRRASGLQHGEDPRPWRRWVSGLPVDWSPRDVGWGGQGAPVQPHTRAGRVRLPLSSDRLCILVDMSGSLWADRGGGRTRKQLLDGALRDLLERMPRTASFNMIPYATRPAPWRAGLLGATARNVGHALASFERSHLTGKGDLWAALQLGLSDPGVDTVLVITDGAPTGGHRWDLVLLADLIERERRWSGAAVSTVLVDASERLERSWQGIAERTGGESTSIQFDAQGRSGG